MQRTSEPGQRHTIAQSETDRRLEETRIWIQILGIYGRIYAELNRALMDKAGISVSKFDALAQLYRYPEGLSMTTLSELLKVTNGNVSGLVARLVKDGLVERQMSPTDRRSFTTRLAPQGRQVFEAALRVHDAVLSDCLQALSPQKLSDTAQTLRDLSDGLKLGKVAGAHVDDADG